MVSLKPKLKTLNKYESYDQYIDKIVNRRNFRFRYKIEAFTPNIIPFTVDNDFEFEIQRIGTCSEVNLLTLIYNNKKENITKKIYDWLYSPYDELLYNVHLSLIDFLSRYIKFVCNLDNDQRKYYRSVFNSISEIDLLSYYIVDDIFKSIFRCKSDLKLNSVDYNYVKDHITLYQEIPNKLDTLKSIILNYEMFKRMYDMNRI